MVVRRDNAIHQWWCWRTYVFREQYPMCSPGISHGSPNNNKVLSVSPSGWCCCSPSPRSLLLSPCAGDQTQGLECARQAFYHWAISQAPYFWGFFLPLIHIFSLMSRSTCCILKTVSCPFYSVWSHWSLHFCFPLIWNRIYYYYIYSAIWFAEFC